MKHCFFIILLEFQTTHKPEPLAQQLWSYSAVEFWQKDEIVQIFSLCNDFMDFSYTHERCMKSSLHTFQIKCLFHEIFTKLLPGLLLLLW